MGLRAPACRGLARLRHRPGGAWTMKTLYLVHHRRNGRLIEAVERDGHYALCSRDADDALGALRAIRADLFVIDVGNPNADGERLLERLRGAPEWRDIPVILTGAWAEQWERL